MICSKCGAELSDSAKFCNKCGAPVAASPAPADGAGNTPSGAGSQNPANTSGAAPGAAAVQNQQAAASQPSPNPGATAPLSQGSQNPEQAAPQGIPNQPSGQTGAQGFQNQPNGQAGAQGFQNQPNGQNGPQGFQGQPNGQAGAQGFQNQPNGQTGPQGFQGQPAGAPNFQGQPAAPQNAGQAAPAAPKKPVNPLIFVAAAGVVVLFFLIIIIAATKKTSVKLDKYVTVEFSGYDTVGTARVVFDSESFLDDYEKKIKFKNSFKKSSEYKTAEIWYGDLEDLAAEFLLEEYVSYELSDYSGLSNGDVVTVTWNCDDDVSDYFKAKLKYSDLEFTVSGLEEAELVNPFDCIVINYGGMAPNGYVEVSYNGPLNGIRFIMDENNCYSNGDTVTIRVQYNYDYATESSLVDQGVILSQLEKEFTVEGLSSYATSIDEISGDTFEAMKSQALDAFLAETAKWDDVWSVSSSSYAGMYFLASKSSSSTMNRVTVIYKIVANLNTTNNDDEAVTDTITYYYPVTFYNCIVLPDGTLSVDTTYYSKGDSFSKSYDLGGWWDKSYSFNGYESATSMFNQLVTSYVENYSYETAFEE